MHTSIAFICSNYSSNVSTVTIIIMWSIIIINCVTT